MKIAKITNCIAVASLLVLLALWVSAAEPPRANAPDISGTWRMNDRRGPDLSYGEVVITREQGEKGQEAFLAKMKVLVSHNLEGEQREMRLIWDKSKQCFTASAPPLVGPASTVGGDTKSLWELRQHPDGGKIDVVMKLDEPTRLRLLKENPALVPAKLDELLSQTWLRAEPIQKIATNQTGDQHGDFVPRNSPAKTLVAQLQAKEAQAAEEAAKLRHQSGRADQPHGANGGERPSVLPKDQSSVAVDESKLFELLNEAFVLKLRMEEFRIRELERRLKSLEQHEQGDKLAEVRELQVQLNRVIRQLDKRKEQRKQIVARRAKELLDEHADLPSNPAPTSEVPRRTQAFERAIAFLKAQQQARGTWQGEPADGVTALAAAALLQAGVNADDLVIQKAVAHLRTVEPTQTYTVALQTIVLCGASPKVDAELVRRNVAWLENAQVTVGPSRGAWSYGINPGGNGDGSCSRFAVLGLDAAQRAGFAVKAETWRRVSDYWLTTQRKNGVWGYTPEAQPTLTMTLAGIAGLATANRHLPRDEQSERRDTVIRKSEKFVELSLPDLPKATFALYALQSLERAGHLGGFDRFGELDWQAVATKQLLEAQHPTGFWKSSTESEVIATSLALLALSGQTEPKPEKLMPNDGLKGEAAFLERVRSEQAGRWGGLPIVVNSEGQVIELYLYQFKLRPGDARIIGDMTNLVRLDMEGSNVSDNDLREFASLKNLQVLNLWHTQVGDKGVAAIAGLSQLRSLLLGDTQITDAALPHVAMLTELRQLALARTRITDAGLKPLLDLKKLVGLKLSETKISDTGLMMLERLAPTLRGITLDDTNITDVGLAHFAQRDGFHWMKSAEMVAHELALQVSAGHTKQVEAMLSKGVDLPSRGKFQTRAVSAYPFPTAENDAERSRRRYRVEWNWNHDNRLDVLVAELSIRQGSARVVEMDIVEPEIVKNLPGQKDGASLPLMSHPDGQHLVAARVTMVASDPDGRRFILITSPAGNPNRNVLNILNGRTGDPVDWVPLTTAEEREMQREATAESVVTAVAFSPDGNRFAVGTNLGQVKVFGTGPDARWMPDALWILDHEAGRRTAKASGKLQSMLRVMGSVASLSFSPDGTQLAVCGESFDDAGRTAESRSRLGESESGSGRVLLFNVKNRIGPTHDLPGHSHVHAVAFSPDGSQLATAGEWWTATETGSGVLLHNVRDGSLTRRVVVPTNDATRTVAFSPDGTLLAIGSQHFDKDKSDESGRIGTVRLVRVGTGIEEWKTVLRSWAKPVAFAPGGAHILVTCQDSLWVVETKTGSPVEVLRAEHALPGRRYIDFSLSSIGSRLFVGGETGERGEGPKGFVELWKLNQLKFPVTTARSGAKRTETPLEHGVDNSKSPPPATVVDAGPKSGT